ncbi:MAG: hypothetical protein IKX35_10850 [Bacteroidales bacterium]|nr:hypothetical protein [Bacteroidales bacterium]
MKRRVHIGFLLAIFALVACTRSTKVVEPIEIEDSRSQTPTSELATIDSLMWQQPDSALVVLMDYLDNDGRDVARRVSTNETFDNHYAQLLASELLFKNDYAQTNRAELLQAVAYFDSIADLHGADARGKADTRGVSVQKRDAFLAARAHYINGVGFYERDSVVAACGEYLKALEIVETHFPGVETQDFASLRVEHLPRFMALTYGRLGDLFSGQFMQEPAIVCYKKTFVFSKIEPTSANGIANLMSHLGKQYDMLKQFDSAEYYYDEGMRQLVDTNNLTFRNLVSAKALLNYNKGNGVEPAVSDLKRMAAKASDEDERLTRFVVVGDIYYDASQFDSAMVYLTQVFENKDDVVLKRDAARCLHYIFQIKGDSLKAAQYARYQVENPVHEGESNRQVSQLNELFQQHLQWKQERAEAERQQAARLRRNRMIVAVCALVVVAALLAWLLLRRKMKQQRDEASQQMEAEREAHRLEKASMSGRLKRSNQELRELQDQLRRQNNTAPKLETQATTFAEEPICRLIMERVNEGQFKSQMDCTIYKDYALGKEQVTALREAADRHFNQFTSRLAKAYPDLTRGDLDYCCLYLLGLSDADVAALMQRAYNTVSQRARKMKAIFGSDEPLTTTLRAIAQSK